MPQNILAQFSAASDKAISHLQSEFMKLQAGRANSAMVENIVIECYGQMQPLKNTASISIPEPSQILIQPWDKSTLQPTEKAIQNSNLGLGIVNNGVTIRLTVPQPTEERRAQLAKTAKSLAEDARIVVRQARQEAHEAFKQLEKDGLISEDQQKDAQSDLQEKVDNYNKHIEDLLKEKEKAIMTV